MENSQEVKYAGFFVRLLATLTDIAIVGFVLGALESIIPSIPFAIFILWGLYSSLMITKWHTTLGGMLFGIKVLRSKDLGTLSFKWAFIRYLISIIPFLLYSYLRGMQHMMDIPPSPTMTQVPQLIFMLLPMIMFFTAKKQMIHDMVIQSVVIDTNDDTQMQHSRQMVRKGRKILRVVGTLAFLVMFGYLILYVSVFYTLAKDKQESYNASFTTHYQTNDYNNSKILFYKNELEKYSKEFIEADDMYDIFSTDVKTDLALGCIGYFLRQEDRDSWLDMRNNFRKNARNKYANNEERIKKAKKNENYMGRHFYTFDLNMVNHITDKITKMWSDKNDSVCENTIFVDELYIKFINEYIPELENLNIHSPYGSKPQQHELDWFEILKLKHPDVFHHAQLQKNIIKKEKIRVKSKKVFECAKQNNCSMGYLKNLPQEYINAQNDEGKTPLMVAVENKNTMFLYDVAHLPIQLDIVDNNGKNIYDYAKQLESHSIYGVIKYIEAYQIIREKAEIVSSTYSKRTGITEIVIRGSECKVFNFPKYILCHAQKTPTNHPIFKAIKDKDNALFDKLFKELQNLDIVNSSNTSLLWKSIIFKNYYALQRLVDSGVDLQQLDPFDLKTPVYWATMHNDTTMLKILLDGGADVNSKNVFGDFALSTWSQNCSNFEAIRMLLDYGANPYLKNKRGKTVLDKKPHCDNKKSIEKMIKLLKNNRYIKSNK
jgi:ankyrin repeat protein/uncharacterized RDD family membrane protein YckC